MSIYLKMAWRNIWRNSRRSLLTMAAIAFATLLLIFMLSFQFGTYETMINTAVKVHTGYFQIQGEAYHEKGDMWRVVPHPEAIGKILDRTPRVTARSSRANAFSLVSSQHRTYGVQVTGVDPQGETTVSTISRLIRQGRYLSQGDSDQAILGGAAGKKPWG